MKSFALLLCLGLFSFSYATDSNEDKGYITKVKGISHADVEIRREEISDKLIKESDILELDAEEVVNVLYKDELSVHQRKYMFDIESVKGECTFKNIVPATHKKVYYHVRDLTPPENEAYLSELADPQTNYVATIGGRADDRIVPTFKADEEGAFELNDDGNKVPSTDKFVLVRPVISVKYDCEEGTFCCGNRCCPSKLKEYLQVVADGDKEHEAVVPVDDEESVTLYVSRKPLNGSKSKRNCGYIIDSDNYFGIKDPHVDAVRYKCPKNYTCCADSLCCKRPEPVKKQETFGSWLAGIKTILIAIFVVCGLLFVAGLWYWCHYRRHTRLPPHTYIAPVRQSSRISRASEASKC